MTLPLKTDPVTILDSAVQSNTTNTNSKTKELQKQKVPTNTTNRSQTPIEEKRTQKTDFGLKKRHHGKKIEKTTTERKTSKKSIVTTYEPPPPPPPKKKTNKKKTNNLQGTQRQIASNRQRKFSNDAIQQHNRF